MKLAQLFSYGLTFLNEICGSAGAYGLNRFLLKHNGEWGYSSIHS
jgi:hypothetical protein